MRIMAYISHQLPFLLSLFLIVVFSTNFAVAKDMTFKVQRLATP